MIIDLNLLRSPNNPDPDADNGQHQFTYSILPHKNRLIQSDVIKEATLLNRPPQIFNGLEKDKENIIRLKGKGLSLEVIKKAEKEIGWYQKISLEKGIKKTLKWYKKNIEN